MIGCPGGHDRRQHRDPDTPGKLFDAVGDSGCGGHIFQRQIFQRKKVQRREGQSHAEPAQIEHPHDASVGRMDRETAGQVETERHDQHAGENQRQDFQVAGQKSRQGRQDSLDQPDRQENAAGHDRRISQPLLHVQRQQVSAAQHTDAEDEKHRHRDPEMPVAEQPDIQERVRMPQFHRDKYGQRDGRSDETADHLRRSPSVRVGWGIPFGEPVDRKRHEQRDADEARPVEPSPHRAFPLFLNDRRQRDRQDADRDVDVEDQVPTEIVHQVAADQRPERNGRGRGHGPQAERQSPLLRRKLAGHDSQSERLDDPAADSLQRTSPDQESVAVGLRAQSRTEREQRQSDDIETLVAEPVGNPPRRRQHDGHRNHIRGHDPLGRRNADMKCGHDGRNADVDDRHVEYRHEGTEHNQAQHPPFVAAAGAQTSLKFSEPSHIRPVRIPSEVAGSSDRPATFSENRYRSFPRAAGRRATAPAATGRPPRPATDRATAAAAVRSGSPASARSHYRSNASVRRPRS